MFDRLGSWVMRHHDKVLFFSVILFGAVAIIWVDHENGSKWVAVGVCASLMVTYAVLVPVLPGIKLRPDQAGDNLYYQGLLFTLTSLGVALYRFTGAGATDSILRNFGIAIFTTIVGLALRVLVGQFREDPEDIEEEARVALSQSVMRMRSELDLSVAELKSFANGMKQVVGEFTTTANKSTTQTLERAVTRFEKASEAMGARLESSAASFQDRSAAFEAALGATVVALEDLTNRVAAVRADEGMVEAALKPVLDRFAAAVGEFVVSLSEQQESFQTGAAAVRQFVASGEGLAASGAALDASVGRLNSAAQGLSKAADSAERLDTASAAAAASAQEFSSHLKEIARTAANQNADAVKVVQQAAQDAAQAVGAQAQQELKELQSAITGFRGSLSELEREFSGSGETIDRVRAELADLAGWIIRKLEPA